MAKENKNIQKPQKEDLKEKFRELLTSISLGEGETEGKGAPSLKERLSAFEQLLRLESGESSGESDRTVVVNFGIPRP